MTYVREKVERPWELLRKKRCLHKEDLHLSLADSSVRQMWWRGRLACPHLVAAAAVPVPEATEFTLGWDLVGQPSQDLEEDSGSLTIIW